MSSWQGRKSVRAFIRQDFDWINRGVIIKNNLGCFVKQPSDTRLFKLIKRGINAIIPSGTNEAGERREKKENYKEKRAIKSPAKKCREENKTVSKQKVTELE